MDILTGGNDPLSGLSDRGTTALLSQVAGCAYWVLGQPWIVNVGGNHVIFHPQLENVTSTVAPLELADRATSWSAKLQSSSFFLFLFREEIPESFCFSVLRDQRKRRPHIPCRI